MLSTLEKNLIGNYANFLRTEPEGKPTIKSNFGRGLSRLPGGQDHEEDLRQMRLHKFASSLMTFLGAFSSMIFQHCFL